MRLRSLLAFALLVVSSARASDSGKLRPYVLYFEGQLDLPSAEVSKVYDRVFEELDPKRVLKERVKKSVVGSRQYTLEAFVEPSSEKDIDYVASYADSHPYFEIAHTKIPLRKAAHLVALETLTGYGPDESGTEREWGAFSRLTRFSGVGSYDTTSFDIGTTLAGGSVDLIRKALPSLLSPTDAYLVSSWFDGVGPSHHKPSRIAWSSSSFFEMNDGTYVSRALVFKVDRKLSSTLSGKRKPKAFLRQGFELQ